MRSSNIWRWKVEGGWLHSQTVQSNSSFHKCWLSWKRILFKANSIALSPLLKGRRMISLSHEAISFPCSKLTIWPGLCWLERSFPSTLTVLVVSVRGRNWDGQLDNIWLPLSLGEPGELWALSSSRTGLAPIARCPALVTDDLVIYDQNGIVHRFNIKKTQDNFFYNPAIFDFNPVIRQLIWESHWSIAFISNGQSVFQIAISLCSEWIWVSLLMFSVSVLMVVLVLALLALMSENSD